MHAIYQPVPIRHTQEMIMIHGKHSANKKSPLSESSNTMSTLNFKFTTSKT